MRKLIVLIMTSVLATGAVANADQVNVVENANDFIQIGGILEQNNDPLASEGIEPYIGGSIPNASFYKLHVDVFDKLGADELVQVAVCLYDSAVITDPDNTDCGDGASNIDRSFGGDNFTNANWQGQHTPERAIQMAFVPDIYDNGGTRAVTFAKPSGGPTTLHNVKPEENGTSFTGDEYSKVTQVGSLGSDTLDEAGEVWALEFSFALRVAAFHSDTWKIRVLATYEPTGGGEETKLELIGEDSYKVKYVGGFDNNENRRGYSEVVDYGDVALGDSATKTITTGEYRTNFYSNITLDASLFNETADTGNFLAFSGNDAPGDSEVSLECGETDESTTFFDALPITDTDAEVSIGDAGEFLSVDPASKIAEESDPSAAVEAPEHVCTFHAGTDITTGEYTNDITIGLLEGSAPVE